MRFAWTLLLICLTTPLAMARTYYVDHKHPAADDSNPGTADRPWRSVTRSVRGVAPGDVVIIRPGVYTERSIVINRSGTPEQPITFMAEKPGTVVIQGMAKFRGYTHNEYPLLFGPPRRKPDDLERWEGAEWITLRGLDFRNSVGVAIGAGTGWRIEDCFVSHSNYDGIVPRGDNIVIERTVVQDCSNNGMAAAFVKNVTIRDCIIRRCNQYPDSPGGNSGACKFLYTNDMTVDGVISYDNFGSGWWMDFDNDNYVITNCTIFGNHAGVGLEHGREPMDQGWAAVGIWTEATAGKGIISNNVIYSNVAAGIGILDSANVIVEGNTIVDCGAGIEFRDLNRDGDVPEEQRKRRIENIIVRNNRIKDWRGDYAIMTSVGEFRRGDLPRDYNVVIENNRYDAPAGKKHISFKETEATTLAEAIEKMGVDQGSVIEPFAFLPDPIPTRTTGREVLKSHAPGRLTQVDSAEAERFGFDQALEGRSAGDVVELRVHGRTKFRSDDALECDIYDLARKRHIKLRLADPSQRRRLEQQVPDFAVLKPVPLKVRMTSVEPYKLEAVLADD